MWVANTSAVYKFLLAGIKQFAFSTLSFMNFELNLHKIAIKVQNGNRAREETNFWARAIKQAIIENPLFKLYE